jgi:hypothetical protein
MSAAISAAAWTGIAIAGSAAVSYETARRAQRQADDQFKKTQAVEAQAKEDAKAYDLQAGKDTKYSETAKTDYGVDSTKKKKLTANDLLISKSSGTTNNS